jgi:hypothetical protein
MRSVPPILVLLAAAAAGEGFEKALEAFEKARPRVYARGNASEVNPALDALAAAKDARAIRPLAELVSGTFGEEDRIRAAARAAQKRGAEAADRLRTIEENLKNLEMQEKAGRTDLGPEILRLKDDKDRLTTVYREVELEVQDLVNDANYVKSLRERVVETCESILREVSAAEFPQACAGARSALDIGNPAEALYLVRILRARPSVESAAPLREILAHPGLSKPAFLAAALALAERKVPSDLRELVAIWKKDPEALGPHMREALCRAAGRDLKSVDDASAWVASLGEK